ncbi:MAG: UPF0182 family protein [Lapillicoccus sp.]
MSERDWFGEDPEAAGQGNGAAAGQRTATRERRRSPLVTTLVILVVVGIAASLIAQFWTEVLWFDSVSFRSVFLTELGAKVLLGVVGGLLTAGIVGSSLYIAYRTRPIYAPTSTSQDALERYRAAVEPLRRIAMIGIPLVIGLLSGLGAAGQWETFLLWRNAQPFGKTDPQFGIDVGFYVFTLPWLTFVVAFLSMALIIGVLVAAFTHYIFGGLQFQARARRTTSAARLHLSILLAAIVLVRAASYWLERYSLTTKSTDLMTGIQYTDANAVLPTKAILAIASIMCALMFLTVIWTKSWRLPIVGVVLLLVVSVVVGGIFPALIQSLRVRPSEKSLEAPYIQNNINATRDAFALSNIQTTPYNAATQATQGQLRNDTNTIPGIRILDPNVVAATYKQLQAGKSYYQFPDTLDVDRYSVDNTVSDTVIAVRELDLDGVPNGQRNWLNDHTVYTHGYGLVAAYGNRKDSDGRPVFFEQNIPSTGKLGEFEPRVYFGEQSPDYSIVGAPAGASPREFDFPDASPAGQANTTYAGQGGVPIGNLPVKLAYAIKYREMNFLLSDAVNSDSRLLDHRTPRDRVARVAPWLTLDGNAYPAVVDGKVLWIVDGYTTTADYPNSHLTSIDQATSDSITQTRQSVQSIAAGQVNYMRNSVKATVDAFDGSVHLYAWDESDPLLKAWMGAFPDSVRPISEVSAGLMSHLRYPEDMFKVQREILARYHVTDPNTFYGSNDLWKVPADPTKEQRASSLVDQPPYYLSIAMPGQSDPQFSLTTTFMPFGTREVLSGFLAVDSNAGATAGQRRDGYGQLRLLELPKDSNVRGPGQVQNDINSSSVQPPGGGLGLSQFLNIQKQQGSSVVLGNLLTLPVGGGLLYVEPIYVQANTSSAYPLNRAIITAFGDKLAWSDSLDGALDALFGGNSGAKSGDNTGTGTTTPATPGTGSTPATGTPPASSNNPALTKALADAQQAVNDADAALKAGDFGKYGEAQTRLKAAISAAAAAAPTGSATLTPGGTPTSTATATSSATPTG